MKREEALLVLFGIVLLLSFASPAAATDGDTSSASITSFSQSNPADGTDVWPDGTDQNTTTFFGESFAVVTDWAVTSATITSNGDLGNVSASATNGAATRSSLSIAGAEYIEARAYYVTGGWSIEVYDGSWRTNTLTYSAGGETSFTTKKAYIGAYGTITSVRIRSWGAAFRSLIIDYLRIVPYNNQGWQHDCSGTGNISSTGSPAINSDGDKVSIAAILAGTASFLIDNTATTVGLDTTYYPILELCVTAISSFGSPSIEVYGVYGSGSTVQFGTLGTTGTFHYNAEAASAQDYTQVRFNLVATETITLDWVALFGIANFTTTVTGGAVDDVAYVSSNALVVTRSTATLFQFDRDPAISVAAATYQRWNISTTTPSAVGCSLYVAAWTTKDAETTWAMPTGTTTDMRIRVTATATITAFKFLVDGSAPACVWSSATPSDPTTTDPVSLWAVITDSYALYKVYFRPITYPVGFSVVDYSATQQQNNLWLYTFSSLPLSGTYCFVVVGTDGANNNTLGATTYLTFTVREAEIIVTTITLFGAGDDFDFVTWTFDINRACTYTIREWSATYAAADTWTGSVAAGIRNIAWPKLSLDDYVNFTVTFVNGSLSYVFSSSYAMPKSTFYFESYLTGEGHKFNEEIVWCSGTLSKAATYTVYCDGTQVETGTVSEDFYVDIDKGLPKGADHLYAFRFVNGSQTLFVNATFYSPMWNIDEPERGGTGVTTEEYWLRTLTVLTFIAVIIIGFGLSRIGNLPNYRGR